MINKTIAQVLWSSCWIIPCLFLGTGCSSSKKINSDFLYFQRSLDSIETIQFIEPVIKNNDLLGIQIFSKSLNQDQVAIFNIPTSGGNMGTQGANIDIRGANTSSQGYLVGMNGNIDLPVIGDVKAAGLTKERLQWNLKQKLSSYVKDPSVFVHFLEFKINVLGEVKLPGTHNFTKDRVTIIDAISAAGDLTDYGKRNDVIVIREESKERKYYRVDLR